MQKSLLTIYLDTIKAIYPCSLCLVIGSGTSSYINILKELNFEDVILVDANQKQIDKMYKIYDVPNSYVVKHALIYKDQENATFNIASNPSGSCFKPLTAYKDLMPNIELIQTQEIKSYSIDTFLSTQNFNPINWLIINTFTAIDILKNSSKETLEKLDILICKTLSDTFQELLSFMLENDFILLKHLEHDNPRVITCIYVKNFKHRFLKIKNEKIELEQQIEQLEQEVETLKAQEDRLITQLENQKNNFEKQLQEESLTKKSYESYIKENQELSNTINTLKNNLDSKLLSLEKQMDSTKRSLTDQIIKSSLNSSKQVEAFISIQNYLIHNITPLQYHGWPISPDIALFIIERIEQTEYDLIIEFGSGTSTALFANIIKQKKDNGKSKPSKVISFEHHETYYKKTEDLLKSQDLLPFSDLVFTPLKEYIYNDQKFIYYDCKQKFQELKEEYKNSDCKVLVLVDGPPGITCPLARFPALPFLLSAFENKQIDLILDDYNRTEEKETAEKWEQILVEKEIKFHSELIMSEKGLYFCAIN